MQQIWNSTDRYPMKGQYIKIWHWEDSELFEVSIHKSNNNMSQMPGEKLASVHMIREDLEKLAKTIEAYLRDYDARNAHSCHNCANCQGFHDEGYGIGEYICDIEDCEDQGPDKDPTGWKAIE